MKKRRTPTSRIATRSVSAESTSDSSLTLFEIASFHRRQATSCNNPGLQAGETDNQPLRSDSGKSVQIVSPPSGLKSSHLTIPCAKALGYDPWFPWVGKSATSRLATGVTNNPRCGPPRGLTLLEVLLVLGILILLAAIVTPSLFNRQRKAMIHATKISIVGLEGALRLYAAEHVGEYPAGSPAEVFDLLMNPGTGEDGRAITPYVEQLPADAWGQALYYEFPTTRHRRAIKPAIWSAGPDQKNDNGAHDDINNWDEVAK